MSSNNYCLLNGRYTTLAALTKRSFKKRCETPRNHVCPCTQCGTKGATKGPHAALLCDKCAAETNAKKKEADKKKRYPERFHRSLIAD